jgi:hypothetical protein
VLAREPRTGKSGQLAGARRLEPHAKPAQLPAPGALRAIYRIVEMAERFAGVREQHLAGWSQFNAAAVATQQLGADLRFETADSLTQGRLREREIFGGPAEAQPLGDRNEVTKVAALSHAAMLPVRPTAPR